MKIEVERDLVRASVSSPEHGVSVDELPWPTAAPMEIGFNGRYLRDALSVFDVDQVELRLAGPTAPALITSPKASGVTLVLMPLRV